MYTCENYQDAEPLKKKKKRHCSICIQAQHLFQNIFSVFQWRLPWRLLAQERMESRGAGGTGSSCLLAPVYSAALSVMTLDLRTDGCFCPLLLHILSGFSASGQLARQSSSSQWESCVWQPQQTSQCLPHGGPL